MKGKTNKKKILTIIALTLLIAGMTVILYPYTCQLLYKLEAKRVISDYESRLEAYVQSESGYESDSEAEGGEWDWLYKLMAEYNRTLYNNGQSDLADALSYQQVDFSLTRFGFDEEMIGYLTVPKMDIELPIYLGDCCAVKTKTHADLKTFQT